MHTVRITFASLFALISLLLTVAGWFAFIKGHGPMQAVICITAFITGIHFGATALYFFRPRAHWDSKLTCPRCHHRGPLRLIVIGQPRYNLIGLVLGGLVGFVLYNLARKHWYCCEACDRLSRLRATGGWLAAAWFLLLVGMAILLAHSLG